MSVSTPTPVIQHTPEEAWQAGPRVPIFTIEHEVGVDPETNEPITEGVEYTMPERPNSALALKYLRMARTMGAEVALGWIFELAIGTDAYIALENESDLDADVLAALMNTVQKRALGGLDAPKGS